MPMKRSIFGGIGNYKYKTAPIPDPKPKPYYSLRIILDYEETIFNEYYERIGKYEFNKNPNNQNRIITLDDTEIYYISKNKISQEIKEKMYIKIYEIINEKINKLNEFKKNKKINKALRKKKLDRI